jgi:hypothetical protein
MNGLKGLALAAVAGTFFMATTFKTEAQVSVNIGVEPACPYGYYDYAPYDCAPSGYYGPEWFTGDVFVGAGPWFHGPSTFHGNVDNHFDPQQGYKGPAPKRGDKRDTATGGGKAPTEFKGNEVRDGRGHTGDAKH